MDMLISRKIKNFLPANRTQRLIKYMELFEDQEQGCLKYPRKAGYVAQRLAQTRKQFNANLLEKYPDNLIPFKAYDTLIIKQPQNGRMITPIEAAFIVNKKNEKNVAPLTAILDDFNSFFGFLKEKYIKAL